MNDFVPSPPLTERQLQRLQSRPLYLRVPNLYLAVLTLVGQVDPIRIVSLGNPRGMTEYCAEVDTFLPQLVHAHSAVQVVDILFATFDRWFGSSAGTRDKYILLATQIWDLINQPAMAEQLQMVGEPSSKSNPPP